MSNWYTAVANEEPRAVDMSLSDTTVFIRRNIEQETWTDRYGESHTQYRYEECKVPKDTYQAIMASIRPISSSMADIRGDLDFLMMMNPDDELATDDTEETPSDEPSTEPVIEDDSEDTPPDRGDFYG